MTLSNVDTRRLKDVFHFLFLNFDADNIPLLTMPLFCLSCCFDIGVSRWSRTCFPFLVLPGRE